MFRKNRGQERVQSSQRVDQIGTKEKPSGLSLQQHPTCAQRKDRGGQKIAVDTDDIRQHSAGFGKLGWIGTCGQQHCGP